MFLICLAVFHNLIQINPNNTIIGFNIDIATARTHNSKNESNDDINIVLDANKKKFNGNVKMIK